MHEEDDNKENKKVCKAPPDMCPPKALNSDGICSNPETESIVLNENDQKDMEEVLNFVMKTDIPENFVFLLRSQLQNCRKDLDIHQRSWIQKNISLCLTLFIRSPQAYDDIRKSNFVQLPSKRLLQYYKNSDFGRHGGIIMDEMTIQDDLIITKSGDTWNLVGFIDMDKTNNNIMVICSGKKKINLATHAVQFVFHGLTGFR